MTKEWVRLIYPDGQGFWVEMEVFEFCLSTYFDYAETVVATETYTGDYPDHD